VEVGHLQAKFTWSFLTQILPTFGLLGSLEDDYLAKVGKTSKLQDYNYGFLCLGGVAAGNWW
jgi:hypothetical protein